MISHDGGSSVVGTHSIGNEISCPAVVSTTRYVPARVSAYVASYVPFPMSTISPPCDVATCPSSTGNPSSSSDASRDASGAVAGAIAIAVAVGVASSRSGSKMANRTRAPPRSMRPPPGLALMSENFASAPATHSDAFVPAIVDNGKLTTPRALAIATSSPLLSSPRSTSATAGGSAATTRSARSASMSSNTLATNVMSIDPDAMIAANFSGASHPASVAASSSGSISIIAAPALNGSISEMMATSLSLSSVFARVCVFSSRTVSTTAANAEATSLGSIASHAADPAANSIRTIIIARLFVGIDARISPTTVASGILDAKIALSLGGKFPNTRAVSEYSIAARTTTAWSGYASLLSSTTAMDRNTSTTASVWTSARVSGASGAHPVSSSSSAIAAPNAPLYPESSTTDASARALPPGPRRHRMCPASFADIFGKTAPAIPEEAAGIEPPPPHNDPTSFASRGPVPPTSPPTSSSTDACDIAARCDATFSSIGRSASVTSASVERFGPSGVRSWSALRSGPPVFLASTTARTRSKNSGGISRHARAAASGSMCATDSTAASGSVFHRSRRIRSCASCADMDDSSAPRAFAGMFAKTSSRVFLSIARNVVVTSVVVIQHIAAAAAAGSIADSAPTRSAIGISLRTPAAAAGRMSSIAFATCDASKPSRDLAARCAAARDGRSPPPPNSNAASSSASSDVTSAIWATSSSAPLRRPMPSESSSSITSAVSTISVVSSSSSHPLASRTRTSRGTSGSGTPFNVARTK
ncbi:uncharacterized protein MICPUCDRAFT_61601 [Micromonas pusilla CCMP1545]|uniref:Predicted protein n=1 Tax=Micromonas pusilla (strain CCMP1545) TaxID=564608 RepID=C1MIC9_MICPC|nr:uncharacterized protein MICPUCDRAFT_61601 [Micromonas pusilla CCMP1545]EEH60898.1 predicted protein [Micromonas pusilla CCMP1545]|eukprot:XP_003055646.1 predicted protein [Micromonas pusilla CCMP1545]